MNRREIKKRQKKKRKKEGVWGEKRKKINTKINEKKWDAKNKDRKWDSKERKIENGCQREREREGGETTLILTRVKYQNLEIL